MAGVPLVRSSPRISSYSLSMSTRCLPSQASLSPLSPPPRPSRPASSMLPARRLADPRSTISHRALVRSSPAVADRFESRFATRRGTRTIAFWRRCRRQEVGSLGNTETCRRSLMPGSIVCRTLESAIRNCEEFQVIAKDVEKILDWENTSHQQVEIPVNLCSPPASRQNISFHRLTSTPNTGHCETPRPNLFRVPKWHQIMNKKEEI